MSNQLTAAASSLSLTATGAGGAGAAARADTRFRLMDLPEDLYGYIFSFVNLGEQRTLTLTSKNLCIIVKADTAYTLFQKLLKPLFAQLPPHIFKDLKRHFFLGLNPWLNAASHLRVDRELLSTQYHTLLCKELFPTSASQILAETSTTKSPSEIKREIVLLLRNFTSFYVRCNLFSQDEIEQLHDYCEDVKEIASDQLDVENQQHLLKYASLFAQLSTLLFSDKISPARKKAGILSLTLAPRNEVQELLKPLVSLYNGLHSSSKSWFVPGLLEWLCTEVTEVIRPELITFAAAQYFKTQVDTKSLETFLAQHLPEKAMKELFTSGTINGKGVTRVLVLCGFLTTTSSRTQSAIAEPSEESAGSSTGAAGSTGSTSREERKAES